MVQQEISIGENDSGWRKSSRCDSGTCLEVAELTGGVAVRDNTQPEGAVLEFDAATWRRELPGIIALRANVE